MTPRDLRVHTVTLLLITAVRRGRIREVGPTLEHDAGAHGRTLDRPDHGRLAHLVLRHAVILVVNCDHGRSDRTGGHK